MEDIEAEVTGSSSSSSKLPKWVNRLIASAIIGIIFMIALQPKICTKTEYDPTTSECKVKLRVGKSIMYGLIAALPLYFIVKKFY